MCGDRMWFNDLKYTKTNVFFVKFHIIANYFEKRDYFITSFLHFFYCQKSRSFGLYSEICFLVTIGS